MYSWPGIMYYKNSFILPSSKFRPENSVRVESMQFRIRNKIQVKTESGSNCLDKNYVRPRKKLDSDPSPIL